MLKQFAIGLAVIAFFIVPILLIKGRQFAPPPPFEFPPEVVTSATAAAGEWEQVIRAVGSLRADHGVLIASEGQGTVKEIAFESGALVRKGDLLVALDIDVERAQLAAAEARAALARINAERARDLLDQNAVAKSEFDATDAAYKQAVAEVASLQALIDKKSMRAPFDGRTGIRLVNLGQFLDRGNPIVTLQSLDPIHADFSLPQQRLAEVRTGSTVRITTDARPGSVYEGRITAISPEVDLGNRTVRVQATLDNASEELSPGLFVNIELVAPKTLPVIAIPATAVHYQSFGDSIFVLKDIKDEKTGLTTKRAEQRFVRLGAKRGDFVSVLEGLSAGEEVATAGVFKLSNGAAVVIDNTLAPNPSLNPQPRNS